MEVVENEPHQRHLQNIANDPSFLADHIYSPEMILTSWFNLSFVTMTVAMVFYGIAMHKTLAHHTFIELITICLIILSTYYAYIGYKQYDDNIKYAIESCGSSKLCSTTNMYNIKNIHHSGTVSSMATIFINALIAILIIYKSYTLQ